MQKTIIALVLLLAPFSMSIAATKTYQVTGPVLEVNADSIVVQKGKEKWEISKDAATKGSTDLKVGDKATVYYTMAANEIEAKGGSKAKSDEKSDTKKKK